MPQGSSVENHVLVKHDELSNQLYAMEFGFVFRRPKQNDGTHNRNNQSEDNETGGEGIPSVWEWQNGKGEIGNERHSQGQEASGDNLGSLNAPNDRHGATFHLAVARDILDVLHNLASQSD